MTAPIRWLALLPDPVTGLDQPIEDSNKQPREWFGPNREYAIRLVRRDLTPNQVRLMSVVSRVDWESRYSSLQRPKLLEDRSAGRCTQPVYKNPAQRCWRCGAPTNTKQAAYCPRHRHPGQRRRRRLEQPDLP